MTKEASLKQRTIKGLFWSFSDLVANQGIQFLIQIILARLLLPEHFGLVGMILVLIAISNTLIESGMVQALVREQNSTQADYSTVFYFNLFMALAIYGVLFWVAPIISAFFRTGELTLIIRILSLGLIINSFGMIQRAQIIKKLDFRKQTIVNIVAGIVSGVVAVICALCGLGVWSLVIKILCMQLFQSALFWYFNRWIPSFLFKYESFKKLFGFGSKLMLAGLLSTFYSNIFNIIIGRMYSATQLGYYSNAQKLNEVASSSITSALQSVTYPVLSSIQHDEEKLKYGFKKIIRISTFIHFPLMIGLAAIANPLVYLLFGEKWMPMAIYFQLLCIAGMMYPLHAINLNILQVKGKADLYLYLSIIKKIMLTIYIFIAIWLDTGVIGLLGAAILDSYVSFLINSFFSGKEIGYSSREQLKDVSFFYAASVIMGLVVYLSGMMLPGNALVKLIPQVLVGLVLYWAICTIAKVKELREFSDIISPIVKKLLGKKGTKLAQ